MGHNNKDWNHEALFGKRINKLLVLSLDVERNSLCAGKRKRVFYICQCDCGNKSSVRKHDLISGLVHTCGVCNRSETSRRAWAVRKRPPSADVVFRDMYNRYKAKAKERGFSFELSWDDFRSLTQKNCYYCGTKPDHVRKVRCHNFVGNGVDRKNSDLGYTIDNVVPCCSTCNIMKNDLSIEDFKNHILKIISHSC